MRAAPAFQVSLQRFGVWRLGVSTIAGLAALSLSAWLAARASPLEPVIVAGVAAVVCCAGVIARSLMHCPPVVLRWDGGAWSVAAADAPTASPRVGELGVAIDLGGWLLLRFVSQGSGRRRTLWLPVQRRGLESQWHALRCAVHAPHRRDPADIAPGA